MGEFVLRTRVIAEERETETLAPGAALSGDTAGRAIPEPLDHWRTPWERDHDRILHSKAFRRLKHKTQVFMNPEGDHFVTRMTHTLQVTQSLQHALELVPRAVGVIVDKSTQVLQSQHTYK